MQAIGVVEDGRSEVEDDFWGGARCCIALDERFPEQALQGLEDFSHAEIVFVFDRVAEEKIVVGARHPRNNAQWPRVGIFAQRGKNRPNRIGTTICRVLGIEGRRLWVAELDAIRGTPVLDIKPVMAEFLPREAVSQPTWSHELMARYWAQADPPQRPSAGAGMPTPITAAIAQLRTTDLDASIRFYTEILGLTLEFRYRDFYAGIRAGNQVFHLKRVDETDPSVAYVADHGHFHVYLRTDDVAALAEVLKRRGVRLMRDVHDTEWGTREIVVCDDQGHTLYFGQNR